MDFILFHSLIGARNELLLFSYDIACQWSRNISRRLVQLPDSMQLSDKQLHLLRFAIPKFHISAHGPECQSKFSLNYQPHMACTDGEDPERWWAHINPVSMSTKEMGPGARLDTLDDHASAWNWRKITGFGMCFRLLIDSATLIFYVKVPLSWVCSRRRWQCRKGNRKTTKSLLLRFRATPHRNGMT
jgi:hypothetical protein